MDSCVLQKIGNQVENQVHALASRGVPNTYEGRAQCTIFVSHIQQIREQALGLVTSCRCRQFTWIASTKTIDPVFTPCTALRAQMRNTGRSHVIRSALQACRSEQV